MQRAAARTTAQGGGRTRCTRGCTEGERELRGNKDKGFGYEACVQRKETRAQLGREAPYLYGCCCYLIFNCSRHMYKRAHATSSYGAQKPLHHALRVKGNRPIKNARKEHRKTRRKTRGKHDRLYNHRGSDKYKSAETRRVNYGDGEGEAWVPLSSGGVKLGG